MGTGREKGGMRGEREGRGRKEKGRGKKEKGRGKKEKGEEVKEQISRGNSSSLTGGPEVGGGLEDGADCCNPEKLIPS